MAISAADPARRAMQTSTVHCPTSNNLVEHLCMLAQQRPDQPWLTVIGERDGQAWQKTLSYAAFELRVRALAAVLQRQFAPGERALVMLDNDEHYAVAMLGCFYAGVIAVPAFAPESARPQHLARLLGMVADARASGLLVCESLAQTSHACHQVFAGLKSIAVDAIDPALAAAWTPHSPAPHDIAFLQYTSGSTSAPKGVMVTHGNLMANQRALQHMMHIQPADRTLCWQPLYHDMGLIGGLLQPLYTGTSLLLISPEYFLQRPLRWLELISRFRITASSGPDFAYRLCCERVKDGQLKQLDLSCWRVAVTGAEPIRCETMLRFADKFGAAGFDRNALQASYGLAEATLLVTAGRPGAGIVSQEFSAAALAMRGAEPSATGSTLVGCGIPAPEHWIEIVDPVSRSPVSAGRVGEIWVSGPSVSPGYWDQPAVSDATFIAWRGARWLRTGDLGLMHGGQLYVTGRSKDLIVVRGHNIYPQDVERSIEQQLDTVRNGRVAAFATGVPEGIGVAVEISRSVQKRVAPQVLVDALGAVVSEVFGEPLSVIALLNPGAVPRTSSGKLQRAACRQACQDRTLDAYALFEHGRFVFGGTEHSSTPPVLDATQAALAALWHDVLQWDADHVALPDMHFFNSGGNSLAAVQAAARIAAQWEIEFPVSVLFEQPRLQAMAQEIQRRCAAGTGSRMPAIAVLPAQQRTGPLPLSHAQQRQWVLWQLDRDGTAYHVNVGLRLAGALQSDALDAALNELIERHAALRTVFRVDAAGAVAQYVQARGVLELHRSELPHVGADPARREVMAQQLIQQFIDRPFDLTQGPLLRACLIRLEGQVHLLVLSLHHIVCDGGSMQVLIDELAQRYQAQCTGEAAPLPALPIQYVDYAAWQRAWLAAGEGERQLEYWRARLQVAKPDAHQYPVLMLPTDHPRRAVARHRAASHEFELPAQLTHQLQQCAQAHGATLFMTLLAGFAALLYRYTGQQDLRIGVPAANRHHPESERVLGLFVNTLVLRAELHGRMPLTELLAQIRATAIDAQAHQDLPFEQLVQALQPQRSLSRNALFQVMFNYLKEDHRALRQMADLSVSSVHIADSDAQFELMLDVRERSAGTLSAVFTYAAELFEQHTIVRLAGHYQALLSALAEDAAQALGSVQYLTAFEIDPLQSGCAAMAPVPLAKPVHALIEQHARVQPQAAALIFEATTLDYRTLNQWANRLALQLLRLGLSPEAKVAVALERTPVMVVSLLACLKAGAVYVPLNLAHPTTRLIEILEDSRAAVLLTQTHVAADLLTAVPAGVQLVLLDEDAPQCEFIPDPLIEPHPRQLAYLIYTSGTTGRPKGVAVEHGALSMHVQAMAEACGMTHIDRTLLFAPVDVDAALEQSLVPLTAGAALVLQRQWSSLASELEAACTRHGITVLDLPPAYARQLLQNAAPFVRPLRLTLFGGEPWSADDLRLIQRVLQPVEVLNAYGPTEAVITPTLWRCPALQLAVSEPANYVPIGRPVGRRRAYVLDEHLQPVPPGIPGELYLAGEGLARGYLQHAGLTAERFVASPFEPGARLYRTGDLVKWRVDAAQPARLEYVERLDHQVKLHGFRIELGEIEMRLRQQPRVREALALLWQNAGHGVLVAYVSPTRGESLDGSVLKQQLQDVLPDYMVPTAIVVLDQLPLNAAGKLDRSALPTPAIAPADRPTYQAPQGAVAQCLAAVWAEVLGVAHIGNHDNFFDLGGDSLLLIRMHGLLEERLQVGLAVTDLFKFPTIDALTRRIERSAAATGVLAGAVADARAQQRAVLKRAALQQRRAQLERTH